jgi:hypothetical protein
MKRARVAVWWYNICMKPLHLDPAWLREKYVDEGLSTYAIGKIVGRDPKSVHTKLVQFGIPRRPKWCAISTHANHGLVSPRRGWRHTEEARQKCIAAATTPHPSMRGEGNPMFGRVGPLHPNYKGGSTPERQRVYASGEWKQLAASTLKAANYACARCGAGNTRAKMKDKSTLHIHHIKGWSKFPALRLEPTNLVVLCRKCHRFVHSRSNVAKEYR